MAEHKPPAAAGKKNGVISKWGHPTLPFERMLPAHRQILLDQAGELTRIYHDAFGIDLFVCYGVLLGFTRAGGLIPHDDDVDLAYISKQTTRDGVRRESKRVMEEMVRRGWTVQFSSYGQYRLVKRTTPGWRKVEIFVGWTEEDRTFLYFALDKGVDPKLFLPLREAQFDGVPLKVPHDTEGVLEAIYGPGWRTPDPDFRYQLTSEKWAPFVYLHANANRPHWTKYYQQHGPDAPWSVLPSQFAAFVANEAPAGRLLEVGCGNGRDALFFARAGLEVTGVDYAQPAVDLCRARAEAEGLAARFETLNVYEWPVVLNFARTHAGKFDIVYARFFVHAVTQEGEEALLRLAAEVLAPEGRLFVEFRTNRDQRAEAGRRISAMEREDGHYRRFVQPKAFLRRARARGLELVYTVAGHGLAPFKGEDPHVARVVLLKPSAETAR